MQGPKFHSKYGRKKRKHVPDPGDEMQLTSPLAIMLLNKFCWGRISACEVGICCCSSDGWYKAWVDTLQKKNLCNN